jgi:hypothetical protein
MGGPDLTRGDPDPHPKGPDTQLGSPRPYSWVWVVRIGVRRFLVEVRSN